MSAATPHVWTFAANAEDLQKLLAGSAPHLPRPALILLNGQQAASLLGLPSLDTPDAVTQAARRMRTVFDAIVIPAATQTTLTHPGQRLAESAAMVRNTKAHADADTCLPALPGKRWAMVCCMEAIILAHGNSRRLSQSEKWAIAARPISPSALPTSVFRLPQARASVALRLSAS